MYDLLATAPTLLAAPDTSGFQSSALWGMIQSVGAVAGVLLIVFGIFKILAQLFSGKASGAFKMGAGLIIGGAFLFNLNLLFTLLEGLGGLVTAIVEAITGLFS
jgi:hypothetical protein